MTALEQHLDDYLAIRRGLGFKLATEQRMLHAASSRSSTTPASRRSRSTLALRWATLPTGVGHAYLAQRMRAVRGFARYLHGDRPGDGGPAA